MDRDGQNEDQVARIRHRIKNNFAVLISLVDMQQARNTNPEVKIALTTLQLRIRSISKVYELQSGTGEAEKISFTRHLSRHASEIARTYKRPDIELNFGFDEIFLDVDLVIPLGLIVNEILNNSYRHAFPGNRPGAIRVTLQSDPEKKIFTLKVSDNGIGLPEGVDPSHAETTGLQIIRLLCMQLEASLQVENNPGASYSITFTSP